MLFDEVQMKVAKGDHSARQALLSYWAMHGPRLKKYLQKFHDFADELKAWAKKHGPSVDETRDEDDGNRYWTEIYEVDGRLYKLHGCNRCYTEMWGERGYVRGVYKPIEVKRERTIVERVEYVPLTRIQYTCKTCGDVVSEVSFRSHMEQHNPNARGMDVDDIIACFDKAEIETE
jgi:hypothetical protein